MNTISREVYEHVSTQVRSLENDVRDLTIMKDNAEWNLHLKRGECDALYDKVTELHGWIILVGVFALCLGIAIAAILGGLIHG